MRVAKPGARKHPENTRQGPFILRAIVAEGSRPAPSGATPFTPGKHHSRARVVRAQGDAFRVFMSLRIYNTLSRELEEFQPLQPGQVRMYVCGMTVYDLCHIGHARMMMAFDVVQRW